MRRFVEKLCHGASLTVEDKDRLMALVVPTRHVFAHRDIVPEGAEARWLPLIIEGWACRYKVLENGKRQIISFLVPGDLCEPFGVLSRFTDNSLGALTSVTLAPVPREALLSVAQRSPRVNEALWWDLLVASAIEREHVVSLGRRSATERLAHLFCELHLRLGMVSLMNTNGFDLPVTQTDLADLLGLSAVHVNRSLQDLRRSGMISLGGSKLVIHDLSGLRDLALFDPAYLRPETTH